jgi:hypothetical protein
MEQNNFTKKRKLTNRSPINSPSNRTSKRPKYNNNNSNGTEFTVNFNENTLRALRAAITNVKGQRSVRFPINTNYTVKRASHFEKKVLPNLIEEGATEENIDTALKNYQRNQAGKAAVKMGLPNYAKSAIQNAAHKFADFIKDVDTLTHVPEFAYHDLKTVFAMINTLPYKTVTKKRMMFQAYKQFAFRKVENNNNTSGKRILMLTPEQKKELFDEMHIKASNWN